MWGRLRAWLSGLGALDASIVALIVFIILWALQPAQIFSHSLVTGGDTGAHLALPAYLRFTGSWWHLNVTPWYPGWFAGMPTYTFYFPVADLVAVLLSYVVGFAVAFKIATIVGSLLIPICAYAMGRLFRAPRPIPIALSVATLPFLFDASFTIDGGNLFSTLAGEYAFSLSLALAMLALGLGSRGMRTGKGYWMTGAVLATTLLSHLLPWMFAVAGFGVLVVVESLFRRGEGDAARPLRFAVGAGIISLGLTAWWLWPFAASQSLTNSMGYTNDSVNTLHSIFSQLGWFTSSGGAGGDRWVLVMAALAAPLTIIWRDRLGIFLSAMAVFSFTAFVVDPQSVIWNERLIPFWYLTTHLLAGWLVAAPLAKWRHRPARLISYVETSEDGGSEVVVEVEDEVERRYRRGLHATVLVALLGLVSTVPGQIPAAARALHLNTTGNQVSAWAQWNYSGYQGKPAWPELRDLMSTMNAVGREHGCGRAMWEYNANQNRFGTPMALMLMPYFTNYCINSMEGLTFESSPTAAYHFLDQSELSAQPSDPEVGLPYSGLNIAQGVTHLQMLGVRYFVAFSPSVVNAANHDPNLRLVTTTRNWTSSGGDFWKVYEVAHADVVTPLRQAPNIVTYISSRSAWQSANVAWWMTPSAWSQPLLAASGPSNWPSRTLTQPPVVLRQRATTVSNVVVGLQSVSFDVSHTGVPVLVKVSYFPRWHVSGAQGPYRVTPNLMVVVPSAHHVALTYGSDSSLTAGNVVTDLTVALGLIVWWRTRRRRKRA
jgi:hypothetical protein